MATGFSFLSLSGCNTSGQKTAPGQVTSGPLTINWQIERKASWAWYTNGGSRGGKISTALFGVRHAGKPVVISTSDGPLAKFSQALFLTDAPKPTVLAGANTLYLMTDENGRLNVKPLNEEGGGFGRFQWLDSETGQPAKPVISYKTDDSQSTRFLSGGRYLLLNGRTVLDVQTLASYPITYPVDVNTSARFPQLANYTVSNAEAVGLSPKKNQLVLVGFRTKARDAQQLEYALVVVDFRDNRVYGIPFDQTNTRFSSMWAVPPGWLTTYFDWTTDPDGREVLRLHTFSRLPYWQGRLELEPNTDQPKQYVLAPVRPGITAHFMDVVRQHHPATELPARTSGQLTIREFTINATKLTLYYDSTDKTLTLTGDDKPLIKTLGETFDRELARGRFQTDFGTFDLD